MDVTFAASAFPPLALGFFGLGTGYLIYGPQELFGWPRRDEVVARDDGIARDDSVTRDARLDRNLRIDRATGVWGLWLPGFCQFVTGIILFIGLTWIQVFTKTPPLYMAALAFSAYGIHWFALGWNRYRQNDPRPNAGMSFAFMVISAMGILVFFHAGDWPVGLLFCGLFGVYFSEFFQSIGMKLGERALGFFHLATGLWLMYLAFAVAVDFSLGFTWRV